MSSNEAGSGMIEVGLMDLPMPEVPPTTNARVGPGKREVMDIGYEFVISV
jgi:hypothetical protein